MNDDTDIGNLADVCMCRLNSSFLSYLLQSTLLPYTHCITNENVTIWLIQFKFGQNTQPAPYISGADQHNLSARPTKFQGEVQGEQVIPQLLLSRYRYLQACLDKLVNHLSVLSLLLHSWHLPQHVLLLEELQPSKEVLSLSNT